MLNYNLIKLDNELEIFHIRKKGFDSLDITLNIRCGSAYEKEENNGISHLLEHMLFCRRKEESFQPFGLAINAHTQKDLTCFEATFSKKYTNEFLPILKKIIFEPNFDQKTLEKNKKIVIEEIKDKQDDPDEILNDKIEKHIFGKNSLSLPVIGSEKSVNSIKLKDLKNWYDKFYKPSNMTLTVVGDISKKEVKEIISKYFEFEKNKNKTEIKVSNTLTQVEIKIQNKKKNYIEVMEKFERDYSALIYPTTNLKTYNFIKYLFLRHLLNQKFRLLIESSDSLYDADLSYYYDLFRGEYQFTFSSEGGNTNKIKKMMKSFIKNVEIDKKFFRKNKDYYINILTLQKDYLEDLSNLSFYILRPEKEIVKIEDEIEKVRHTSLKEIQKLKNSIFQEKNLFFCSIKTGEK